MPESEHFWEKKILLNAAHLRASNSHLAAESSRCLLTSTLPGSVGAVDVVESRNSHLDAEVLAVVHSQLLTGQLLQSVRILWLQPRAIRQPPHKSLPRFPSLSYSLCKEMMETKVSYNRFTNVICDLWLVICDQRIQQEGCVAI